MRKDMEVIEQTLDVIKLMNVSSKEKSKCVLVLLDSINREKEHLDCRNKLSAGALMKFIEKEVRCMIALENFMSKEQVKFEMDKIIKNNEAHYRKKGIEADPAFQIHLINNNLRMA